MDSIEGSGYPIGFPLDATEANPLFLGGAGEAVVTTEARMMAGHQKEAIVHEGQGGPRWRLTSDEGIHLGGADMAPFPLGFFNAGLHGEVMARSALLGADPSEIDLSIQNFYWMTGSFAKGTGEGFSDPTAVIQTGGANHLKQAVQASPAFDALRRPLKNTFALYINGRREEAPGMTPSDAPDAPDPFLTYREPPAPPRSDMPDVIRRTDHFEEGEIKPAPVGTDTRIIRTVSGRSRLVAADTVETDTWLEMPGVTHFTLQSGWARRNRTAPSALALLSAAISFCYLTQLSRYIQHMKMDISGMRIVQYSPYASDGKTGHAGPVDTHLFLNGRADDETHGRLMRIAARTCYLHATLAAELPPVLTHKA